MKYLKKIPILIAALLLHCNTQAQDEYWQQKVDTRIEVTLDDVSHILRGTADIDYTNNSPDTLKFIYFHLWPNAYSNDRTAYNKQAVENGDTEFYTADKEDWGFIDSLQFTSDGVPAAIVPTEHKDIIKVLLKEPVTPGSTIHIATPFYLQIPTTFSRLGHAGQSYQITQWFPKPAVYDKNGWNPIPYLDQGEFYSEFGSYDVSITLPKNYVVMATGNLQTESEIVFLDNLATQDIDNKKAETPASSPEMKTIRYTEENVHDFAWFADKTWAVRKKDFQLKGSDKTITAWSAFYPHHLNGWKKSLDYITLATAAYSSLVGPYPYSTVKAVEGPLIAGGGMEYPTVTIIIPSDDSSMVREVIVHEVGHNWFYGMLANNERVHPWMDESINTFIEDKIISSVNQEPTARIFNAIENLPYLINNSAHNSQPVSSRADVFRSGNYGSDLYRRGSFNFAWLEAYMGEEDFYTSLQQYFSNYRFRHVYPEDFEKVFRAGTAKNLDWFFGDALNSTLPVDYSIKSIRNGEKESVITLKNHSGINGPAIVELTQVVNDSNYITKVASDPFTGTTSISVANNGGPFVYGSISKDVPDAVISNNFYRNGGSNHIKFRPFQSLNNQPYTFINYLPAVGYNDYDGFMLGLLVHNLSIPAHKFQFALAPMYGFGSKHINGTGFLSYTSYPKSKGIHNIEYRLEGKSFGYLESDLNIDKRLVARYMKVAPEVIFTFQKPHPRSELMRTLSVKGYWINEEKMSFIMDDADSLYRPHSGGYESNIYGKIRYKVNNNTTYNPYGYTLEAQGGKNFVKLSLEGTLKVDYHFNNKALYVRGFIGKFFELSDNSSDAFRYNLATTYSGWNDYLYDETFLGRNRNEGLLSKQIANKEGGMKINTLLYANQLGLSNNWLGAVNLKSDLPLGRIPIRVFADIATFTNAESSNPSGAKFLWDAGFEIDLFNMLQINIPLVYSTDYKDYLNSVYGKKAFLNSISFSLNINNIHWSKATESIGILRSLLQ